MVRFVAFVNRVVREEEGQDVVEYTVVVGLLSLASVGGIMAVGDGITPLWEAIATEIGDATALVDGLLP